MVKVVRNGEIIHANEPDILIDLRRLLLELFLGKDIVVIWLGSLGLLLCIHILHLVVHVRNFLIDVWNSVLLSCTCIVVIIHIGNILHHIINVDNLIALSICWWSRLKPAIFQGHFLDGTSSRFNISDTLLTRDTFSDQELFLSWEIVILFASFCTSPSNRAMKEFWLIPDTFDMRLRTYFQVGHLCVKLSPAITNSLGIS